MDIKAQLQLFDNILVKNGLLSPSKLREIEERINKNPSLSQEDLENIIINEGFISEEKLLIAYSQYLNIPYFDLKQSDIDSDIVSLIPAKFANDNKVIAIGKEDGTLIVALRNPFDINIVDELKILTGFKIKPVISKLEDIVKAIKVSYGVGAETVEKLIKDSKTPSLDSELAKAETPEDLEEMAKDSSIVNYVNQLLMEAYKKRATDIHIEPFRDRLRIRFRIDGVLYEIKSLPDVKKLQPAIVSRFKIMAKLNIAERRRPQDGRCRIKLHGQEVDLRLSTFPTLFGEGLSIRLLISSSILFGLDELGFPEDAFSKIKVVLNKPNGMILVTGPTGCGKTTTLYACLSYLNDSKVNIVSLEDPIEYQLEGVNQIQVNPKIDLTFANGLRSILRQDPDVIMVGEIRDLDTAQISVRAALTGHLIFSTLHTNDALSSVNRLFDLGIEPYLVANTLRAVIAQRLIRIICNNCKKEYLPDERLLEASGFKREELNKDTRFFKGSGCSECNNAGYKGRTAIFEFLVVDDDMSSLIAASAARSELAKQARILGMKSLKESGIDKVKNGITTLEEVIRVTEQE